jgi:hypothetical protein
MKRLCALAVAALVALASIPAALGQAVVIEKGNAADGRYYYVVTVAGGAMAVAPLPKSAVTSIGQGPTTPTDPAPPPTSTLAQWTRTQTLATISSGGTAETAAGIATVYDLVGTAVENGSIPQDQALDAITGTINLLLGTRADKDKWAGFRSAIAAELNRMIQDGKLTTKAQFVATLGDIEAGMKAAVEGRASIGNAEQIDWKAILEMILRLIMEYLLRKTGGAALNAIAPPK